MRKPSASRRSDERQPWDFALLQAADLVFGYGHGTPVIRGVSLTVPGDALVGILGPNGSGKTTLLRLLGGMRVPSSGTVTLDGVPLSSISRAAAARRIAVVPQETQLAFDYTVLEVVLMGRYAHLGPFAVEGPADLAFARKALAATGASPFEDRLFSTLSGGEKQRVIIAGALAQISAASDRPDGPAILLLDEPTAALDLKYHLGVASLLQQLHRDRGLTIVVSTHDLSLAATLCTTLVMLKDGRVMAAGSVDEVLTPARVRELYEVEVDIARHPRTGHLTVVPLAPLDTGHQR
jgi:iron complex transport system ATP-binding protein